MTFTQFIQEWENFILIQASIFDIRKEQLVYEIVNYNMVLSILSAQTHIPLVAERINIPVIYQDSSKLCSDLVKELNKRYKNMINQVCLEELAPFFERLISFTNCFTGTSNTNEDEIMELSNHFAATWKNSLMVVAVDIKKLFAPSYIDQEIKEVCMSMLIDYYRKFVGILSNHYPVMYSKLVSKDKIVDIHQILVEIKKYR
ncbi:Vacuolar protein sorting-associated protein 52 [Thelohanellus kitauei]|nr:Vacuolar protein sorting-associated protein 52 [Thelohanellus kitauei]